MAKIRAYKLAQELQLEPDEFLKRLNDIGIEVRSKMASVDVEQAEEIRRRLGVNVPEQRVEKRVGAAVIRRRKKVTPVAEETPASAAPEAAAEEPAVAASAGEGEELVADAPAALAKEDEAADGAAAAGPEGDEAQAAEAPAAPVAARPAQERDIEADRGRVTATPTPGKPGSKRPVKRTASEAANLKEQDTLARTMLGNVQHRLEQRRTIVEQQARLNPRRRRAANVGRSRSVARPAPVERTVRLTGELTFQEFSKQAGVKVRDLLRRARQIGAELDRDDLIDVETAQLLGAELGVTVELALRDVEGEVTAAALTTDSPDAAPRPPIVTVMGHVDHGKTSLLDAIRSTNVVAGEAGGITQHIGAYQVEAGGRKITFIDTPGHAAFTQMRARGAQVTDVVILVIAADDGIMPQTVEAINHAKAANAPIVVAINKVDLPNANVQRAKNGLLEHELVLEELGGDVLHSEVSAIKGTNLDALLEQVNLQAELQDLKARPNGPAKGFVIEASLDKGRGPVATVLVLEGKLKRGDVIVAGTVTGRVRSMADDKGKPLKEASPSMPAQIIGLSGVPEAGDELVVVKNDRDAKSLVDHRVSEQRRRAVAPEGELISAEDLFAVAGDEKELRLVVKADVRGTAEAVREAAEKLSTERVSTHVIHTGVGGVNESDVMLASASSAIVMGFHVRPDAAARKAGEAEGVQIRCFDLIHEALDDVAALMTGLLPPKVVEEVTGHAEVRQLFVIPRVGTISGCAVQDGVIRRNNMVRIVRDGVVVYSGRVASLRHVKDDVREIAAGRECGLRVENFNDVKLGDVLESYSVEERPDTL